MQKLLTNQYKGFLEKCRGKDLGVSRESRGKLLEVGGRDGRTGGRLETRAVNRSKFRLTAPIFHSLLTSKALAILIHSWP